MSLGCELNTSGTGTSDVSASFCSEAGLHSTDLLLAGAPHCDCRYCFKLLPCSKVRRFSQKGTQMATCRKANADPLVEAPVVCTQRKLCMWCLRIHSMEHVRRCCVGDMLVTPTESLSAGHLPVATARNLDPCTFACSVQLCARSRYCDTHHVLVRLTNTQRASSECCCCCCCLTALPV
jgi:hypothetical protein